MYCLIGVTGGDEVSITSKLPFQLVSKGRLLMRGPVSTLGFRRHKVAALPALVLIIARALRSAD